MPSRTQTTATSVIESLSTLIPKAFDQAQTSTANHQKNFVALHKLHADAAGVTESINNGSSIKLTGERAFEDVFVDMVSRVLSVKKGASQADRIVRFTGGYTKFINEKCESQISRSPKNIRQLYALSTTCGWICKDASTAVRTKAARRVLQVTTSNIHWLPRSKLVFGQFK